MVCEGFSDPTALVVTASACLINCIYIGTYYCSGVFFYHFLYTFGGSRSATALVFSLMSGTYYISGLVSGPLITKYGARPTAVIGTILSSIGLALSAFASAVWMLYITYGIITGFSWGLMMCATTVIVQQHTNKRRAFAGGISYLPSAFSGLVYPLMLKNLESIYGWRGALLLMGGLQLNCLPLSLLLVPPQPSQPAARSDQKLNENVLDLGTSTEMDTEAHKATRHNCQIEENQKDDLLIHYEESSIANDCMKGHKETFSSITGFQDRESNFCTCFIQGCQYIRKTLVSGGLAGVTCILAYMLRFIGITSLYIFLPVKVASAGFEPSTAAYFIMILSTGDLVGRIVTVCTSSLHNRLPMIYFVLATLTGGIFECCFGYSQTLMVMVGLVSSIGVTNGIQISVGSTVARDTVGIDKFPWVLGLAYGAAGISNFVSIQLMTWLWEETGSLSSIFSICGICLACSGMCYIIYLCVCRKSNP